jgi:tetratricopeptide (TPR) repeat protein
VWNWVSENRTRAATIAGAAAGVVLVAVLAKSLFERSHAKRDEAVSAAVARYGQAAEGAPAADLAGEFSRLAKKYEGAPAGKVARYFEGAAQGAAGDAEKARQAYQELRGAGPAAGDLAPLAGVALAYLELSQGHDEAALGAFQGLLDDKAAALPRAQIMMEIAALQEKRGKIAEALETYREVVAAHPDGSWAAPAKERVRALSGKGPAAS